MEQAVPFGKFCRKRPANPTTRRIFTMVQPTSSQPRTRLPAPRHALALKVLPAVLLGCFAAQPLFAQTTAPAKPAAAPATAASQAGSATTTAKPAPAPETTPS